MMRRKVKLLFVMLCLVLGGMGLSLPGADHANTAYALGTTYYLDPNGNDNNNGTSLATPWQTLNKARLVLAAGDTLLMRGGNYPTNWFSPVNSGSAGNPITLKAYNNEVPVITGDPTYGTYFKFDYVDYIVIDGLHFENTTGGNQIFTTDSDYITIKNSVFRNHAGDTQVNLSGAYNLVENNIFDTAGDPLGDGGQGAGDNLYLRGASYSIIQNNTFTKGGHYSIDIIDAYDETQPNFKRFSHHNIIRNNSIDQGWGGGIGLIRGTSYTLVENNFIKNAGVAATYPKTGIQLAAEKNIIRNNIISKPGSPTKTDSGLSVSSYRFSGIDQNVLDNRVYNNVIYKSGKEPVAFTQRDATQLTRNKFVNNIIYYNRLTGDSNPYWAAGNYYFTVETYHAFSDNKWPNFPNNNQIYDNIILHADATGNKPGEKLFFYDQGDQFPVCYCNGWSKTLAQTQTDYPLYIHDNIEQNPLYVNAEADNFNLQSGSPAIDAGAHLAKTTAAGTNTTSVPVDDAFFFFDGYGLVNGDMLKIGSNAPVQVTNVNTATNVLTVASPVSFAANAFVDLPYNGSAPDIGAKEYAGSTTVVLKNGVNGYQGNTSFHVSGQSPTTNFGQSAYHHVANPLSGTNGYVYRPFYKFDVSPGASGIPANATIQSASLKLYVEYVTGDSTDQVIKAHRVKPVNNAFTVNYGSATKNTYDGTNAWTGGANAGGDAADANNDFLDTPDGQAILPNNDATGYITIDVTSSIQAWVNGETNNGWVLLPNGKTIYIGTAGDLEGSAQFPELTVQYSSAAPSTVTLKNGVNGYQGNTSFHVSGQSPTTNFGQSSYYHVLNPLIGTNGYVYRPFYRFDVSPAASGIPANAAIQSATLKLYVEMVGGEPTDQTVNIHRVKPVNNAFAVNYGSATRNTYNGTNAWTGGANAGGDVADANNDFLDTPDSGTTLPANGSTGYITFDVKASVQAWVNGEANNGLLLISNGKTIYIGTAADLGGSAQFPELTVTYQ